MKPFLKWAGNKYQIIERIKAVLPPGKRLIEPFVGSGAVFLNTEYPSYLLGDANADLINLYQQLQAGGQRFIEYCRPFFVPENNQAERFYELRQQFNSTVDPVEKAAIFVYLNKHCYNGLCRYNASGRYNVPFGRNRSPYFPEREMQIFYDYATRAKFLHADFLDVMKMADRGDVVYCDPPYVPLSATAHFTSYSSEKFGSEKQIVLALAAEQLSALEIPVLISNHLTNFTESIYNKASLTTFHVRRSISCNASNRNHACEVLALYSTLRDEK